MTSTQNYTNTKFITNNSKDTLEARFNKSLINTKLFDVLVGFFRISGFKKIFHSLENVEKIRILVGINLDSQSYQYISLANQSELRFYGDSKVKEQFSAEIENQALQDENEQDLEESARKLIEFIKSKKLEIRAYSKGRLHAKVYIFQFNEEQDSQGKVITGSSNFSESGLVTQREFNVELKDDADLQFASDQFNELWQDSSEISQDFIETITTKTWLNDQITPYEIYLKFLYEYFKEEIEYKALDLEDRPENFKEFKYQAEAVINAKRILKRYGGVFISDVVGLGKTYMGTMLCQQLNKKVLVIAPPHLVDKNNLGSWNQAFKEFGFKDKKFSCQSLGNLEKIINKGDYQNYDIVLIDESHRFRSQVSESYDQLSQICRGKQVILVTATPYNNRSKDLLSQIKLFQSSKKSNIPGIADLDYFFKSLEDKFKSLDRQTDQEKFLEITKKNAGEIRQKVLKHLMIRRTRKEISHFYKDDLAEQNIKFPKIADPKPIFYEFNDDEEKVFIQTLGIIKDELKYARYTPKLYLAKKVAESQENQGQKNMKGFMKTILIKRLESSFFAFKNTIDRFIKSYEDFIESYEKGFVYISKTHSKKIFEYLENGALEKIDELLQEQKAEKYEVENFKKDFYPDLMADLENLKTIATLWEEKIKRDPKLIAFKEKLAKEPPFKKEKSIIFTESKETAEYLERELSKFFEGKIICFTGKDGKEKRQEILDNFDANSKKPKNDYKILIATDVLAEGINLHQADVVVNYDIPWNPARMIQRVGRINRVDTKFDEIFTYTFFPTAQSNSELKLKELAENKIAAFISMLGNDAKLLTENEEITSHNLFDKLLSKSTIEGEEEPDSELEYLQEIREIFNQDQKLFEKIKKLPKKARSSRAVNEEKSSLITYFKKGNLDKFFQINEQINEQIGIAKELDFVDAAKILKASKDEKKLNFDQNFYNLLNVNKEFFEKNLKENENIQTQFSSKSNYKKLLDFIGKIKKDENLNQDQIQFLQKLEKSLEEKIIPEKKVKDLVKTIKAQKLAQNPIRLVNFLKDIPPEYFQEHYASKKKAEEKEQKTEVILSQYFKSN